MILSDFHDCVTLYKKAHFDKIQWYDPYQKKVVSYHKKQIKALHYLNDDVTSYVGYGGAARGGKSMLLTSAALFECFVYPEARYLLGRKNLKLLKETTLKSLKRLLKTFNFKEGRDYKQNNTTNEIIFPNGSEIIFKNLELKPRDENADEFGSLEITKAFIDQSENVSLKIIEKVNERVGSHLAHKYGIKGKLMEAFNPSNTHVKTRYWIPYRDKKEKQTRRFVRALPSDNPGPAAKKWVADKEKNYADGTMREVEYQKQIKGNFDYDDNPDLLVNYDNILNLLTNTFVKSDVDNRYLIADVAMKGSDSFVIKVWYGNVQMYFEEIQKCGGKQIIDKLKEVAKKYMIPQTNIIYDGDGLGSFIGGEGGFLENAHAFLNNSRPTWMKKIEQQEGREYRNLKVFCAYKLAEKINNNEYFLMSMAKQSHEVKQRLQNELMQLKGVDMGNDQKRFDLISKKEMKQNLGHSPDYLDCLIMREYINYIPRRKRRRSY